MAAGAISSFTDEGLLPPGDYEATFGELRESVLVTGPAEDSLWREGWDAAWREHLTYQAETLCGQLWSVGIGDIFLDGSFVEAKGHPNDIDGYFACDARRIASGDLKRDLNQIDPESCWTWDASAPRAYRGAPTAATPSGNFRCGMPTASNSTLTTGNSPVSPTSAGTRSLSRRPSASAGATGCRRASSRSSRKRRSLSRRASSHLHEPT